ncbi:MAG: hypothetical protein U0797_04905 [Gemmataceae bacterium]
MPFPVQGAFAMSKLPLPANLNLALVGGAAAVLFLLLVAVFALRGRKKADPEAHLAEDVAAIPAPPKGPRHYQLLVLNQPVRLRYVVVAPMGRRVVGKVDSTLEQVYRGLGEVAVDDKPRVRVWPPQLSAAGFAPTFFRMTRRPDPDGKASRWVLLAGPARAGSTPVLLGLAVQADEVTKLGLVTMTETRWAEVLRVENA